MGAGAGDSLCAGNKLRGRFAVGVALIEWTVVWVVVVVVVVSISVSVMGPEPGAAGLAREAKSISSGSAGAGADAVEEGGATLGSVL